MKRIKVSNMKSTVSVSVTGTVCQLDCKHCGRHYLKTMIPIWDLERIPTGTKSLLISGGSMLNGRVPVLERLDLLRKLKKKGYRLNFHVGLVDEREAREISEIADAISFDFVGSGSIARKIYNLDVEVDDYKKAFEFLLEYGSKVYPHVTVGLDCGKISHEYEAIDILSGYSLEKVVFIVFIPTPGTVFESCSPPTIEEISEFFGAARRKLDCALNLGCMYPKGKMREEIAVEAVKNGFDLITQPTMKVLNYLETNGYEIEVQDECCVL